MELEALLKEDFINTLVTHRDKSEAEALDVWNEQQEYYIEAVYQHMSDEIIHYLNIFENNTEE